MADWEEDWEAPCADDDMFCWGFESGYHAAMMDMADHGDWEEGDHEWDGTTDGDDAIPDETAMALAAKKGSKSKGSKLAAKKGSKSKGSKLAEKKGSKSKGSKLASKKGGDKQDWHCDLWEEDDQPWCVEWETRCNEDPEGCWDDMAAEWEKEDKQ